MHTLTAPQRPDERRNLDDFPLRHLSTDRIPRTTVADRIALRLALALVLWSTRPHESPTHATRRNARDREIREREWHLRAHRLPLS